MFAARVAEFGVGSGPLFRKTNSSRTRRLWLAKNAPCLATKTIPTRVRSAISRQIRWPGGALDATVESVSLGLFREWCAGHDALQEIASECKSPTAATPLREKFDDRCIPRQAMCEGREDQYRSRRTQRPVPQALVVRERRDDIDGKELPDADTNANSGAIHVRTRIAITVSRVAVAIGGIPIETRRRRWWRVVTAVKVRPVVDQTDQPVIERVPHSGFGLNDCSPGRYPSADRMAYCSSGGDSTLAGRVELVRWGTMIARHTDLDFLCTVRVPCFNRTFVPHCPTQAGTLKPAFSKSYNKSGRQDLNLRPLGPETNLSPRHNARKTVLGFTLPSLVAISRHTTVFRGFSGLFTEVW
jgi:hypothetical protein